MYSKKPLSAAPWRTQIFFYWIWGLVILRRIYAAIKTIIFPPEKPVDKIQEYSAKIKQEFLCWREKPTCMINSAVGPEYYSLDTYRKIVKSERDVWKTRILMVSLPTTGENMALHYDPFKLAFVYHADTKILPYEFMNAAAMQYCRKFRCMDFFMDESVFVSPLLSALKSELIFTNDPVVGEANPRKKNFEEFMKMNAGVFAVRRQDGLPKTAAAAAATEPAEKMQNRFIYGGLFREFQILQKPKPVFLANTLFFPELAAGGAGSAAPKLTWKSFKEKMKVGEAAVGEAAVGEAAVGEEAGREVEVGQENLLRSFDDDCECEIEDYASEI